MTNDAGGQAPDKAVFTTGQISRMLTVAPRTVSKWCDSGRLVSYRIPRSSDKINGGDRRVTKVELLAFLCRHSMPLPPCFVRQVLAVGLGGEHAAALRLLFPGLVECRGWVELALNLDMTAGHHLLVLDSSAGRSEALAVAGAMAVKLKSCRIIALTGEDDAEQRRWLDAGCHAVLRRPFPQEALLEAAVKEDEPQVKVNRKNRSKTCKQPGDVPCS